MCTLLHLSVLIFLACFSKLSTLNNLFFNFPEDLCKFRNMYLKLAKKGKSLGRTAKQSRLEHNSLQRQLDLRRRWSLPRWVEEGAGAGGYQQTLNGSLSAVSKPIFARIYTFCSIFQAYKRCVLLHGSKFDILAKNRFLTKAI